MRVCHTEKIPIKMWLEDIEEGAMSQLKNLANLPFAFKHIAVMPDSHQGYGMPIGGVLATKGMIIPNAVGVDIGCGMLAVETDLEARDMTTKLIKEITIAARVGGDEVEVVSGLNEGDQIVEDGSARLSRGKRVRAIAS